MLLRRRADTEFIPFRLIKKKGWAAHARSFQLTRGGWDVRGTPYCGQAGGAVLSAGEGTRSEPEFLLDANDLSFGGETLFPTTFPAHLPFNQSDGSVDPIDLKFTTSVVRETATGRLAFHYDFEPTGRATGRPIDLEFVLAAGDRGVGPVDVHSDNPGWGGQAWRFNDGDAIRFEADEQRFACHFVVRTSATQFRQTGGYRSVDTQVRGGPFDAYNHLSAALGPMAWPARGRPAY